MAVGWKQGGRARTHPPIAEPQQGGRMAQSREFDVRVAVCVNSPNNCTRVNSPNKGTEFESRTVGGAPRRRRRVFSFNKYPRPLSALETPHTVLANLAFSPIRIPARVALPEWVKHSHPPRRILTPWGVHSHSVRSLSRI